jgi:hypothetical protein
MRSRGQLNPRRARQRFGIRKQAHIDRAGVATLDAKMTPDPSIELTCPGKPGVASHLKR